MRTTVRDSIRPNRAIQRTAAKRRFARFFVASEGKEKKEKGSGVFLGSSGVE